VCGWEEGARVASPGVNGVECRHVCGVADNKRPVVPPLLMLQVCELLLICPAHTVCHVLCAETPAGRLPAGSSPTRTAKTPLLPHTHQVLLDRCQQRLTQLGLLTGPLRHAELHPSQQ
jgi:hypothetical protein